MSRTGIVNTLIEKGVTERNVNLDTSTQLSMFEIWDELDDTHETTYQLISPKGDIIDLTFTTKDPRAFDSWCIEEGLNPNKIHAIAHEGLNSAYKDWFVKIIETPVEIPEEQPEPVVEEKPKKKPRKRKAKAKAKAATVKKPRKRKAKAKTASIPKPKPVIDSSTNVHWAASEQNENIEIDNKSNADYLAEKDTSGWHEVPRALKIEASAWKDAEEIPTPVNRKQRRAAKKRTKRKG